MFFLDKPYVSEFLKSTLKENYIPIVGTKILEELDLVVGVRQLTLHIKHLVLTLTCITIIKIT